MQQEPLETFFVDNGCLLHTPLTAFVSMARSMGFELQPDGLYLASADSMVHWPPESMGVMMHELREAMRKWVCTQTTAPLVAVPGTRLSEQAFQCAPTLTRTQLNFLATVQANAHRAALETQCPLCGEAGGFMHAVYECEERSLEVVRREPAGARAWPENFKRLALLTKADSMDLADQFAGQDFITRVLIERRMLQRVIDEANRAPKRTRTVPVEEEHNCMDDDWQPHPQREPQGEQAIIDLDIVVGEQELAPHPPNADEAWTDADSRSVPAMLMTDGLDRSVVDESERRRSSTDPPPHLLDENIISRACGSGWRSDRGRSSTDPPPHLIDENWMNRERGSAERVTNRTNDDTSTTADTMAMNMQHATPREASTPPLSTDGPLVHDRTENSPVVDLTVDTPHQKRPRKQWDLSALPEHIALRDDGFTLRYECKRCGCHNATKTRSMFFDKHLHCQGLRTNVRPNRHFLRKASLQQAREERPCGLEVINAAWYQDRGILPVSLKQPWPGAPIECT
eukprot:5160950-Amphidinium_carterae.1